MMNGNYGGGWMGMGGGWMMIIGVLVCIAIIGAVVWLVMRLLKNKQSSFIPQQPLPSQMNGQGYQPPPQQSAETYQEGDKQYSYPQSVQYPQQQERPLN
jgi:predicted lipid-binding transport protein (Tim44 family)